MFYPRSKKTRKPWRSIGVFAGLACATLSVSWSHDAYARRLSFDRYDDSIRHAAKIYWGDFPDWKYWKAQLFQESTLDPDAKSGVGALGLAQFMPATWEDITRQLGWSGVSASQAEPAIEAGAFYMARLRKAWSSPRPQLDRHQLAEASYNAGTGNLVKAQRLCGNKAPYAEISPCLPLVTGEKARETLDYVVKIDRWHEELEARLNLQK